MYTPKFMQHYEQYRSALAKVNNCESWVAFTREWFDTENWPKKTALQFAEESRRKQGHFEAGGRLWGYWSLSYDITPEARYEYFYALRTVGGPLVFPEWESSPKTAEEGWRQECPYCEISTATLGSDVCPKCGRQMVLQCVAD